MSDWPEGIEACECEDVRHRDEPTLHWKAGTREVEFPTALYMVCPECVIAGHDVRGFAGLSEWMDRTYAGAVRVSGEEQQQ